jgi:isocitrate dehydrogenase kinase/phosphatase
MSFQLAPLDYPHLVAVAGTEDERIPLVAAWIRDVFEHFYDEWQQLTRLSKQAFERRDHPAAVAYAKRRLGLYNATVYPLAEDLRSVFPALAQHEVLWDDVEAAYLPLVRGIYEADLALAYLHSARRRVYHGEWRPVEYGFGRAGPGDVNPALVYETFRCQWPVAPTVLQGVLQLADLNVPFRDLEGDAFKVASRLNDTLAKESGADLRAIHMIRAGFFRNRAAYLVGRLVVGDGKYRPFVIALLNGPDGVFAEAVLTAVPHVHNLFSSTLATFQVTNVFYHQLSAFLHTIMPRRPLGLQYSTIGFHHVSKVAVMNEVRQYLADSGSLLDFAPGFPGTVAVAFTASGSDYVFKVIRDRPTSGYKWPTFEGIDAVLNKYKRVHEINRTGSMLDNTLYYNLKLDRSWFRPALLEELLNAAGNSARLQDDAIVFRYLVAQRTLTPLNLFLESAPETRAERAIINLGYCIKNNAAANVFNRDFDARNYGVNRYLKVYLYDYDAVEALTDVKVRTNLDRCEGEEDVPSWFFEDGLVFLPEEIESGLRVDDRALRRAFRSVHGDLLTVDYWEDVQRTLRAGQIPGIHTYPEACHLGDPAVATVASE